jgi:hypothetical protein
MVRWRKHQFGGMEAWRVAGRGWRGWWRVTVEKRGRGDAKVESSKAIRGRKLTRLRSGRGNGSLGLWKGIKNTVLYYFKVLKVRVPLFPCSPPIYVGMDNTSQSGSGEAVGIRVTHDS